MINNLSSVNRYSKVRVTSSKIDAVLTQLTLSYTSILIHHLIFAGIEISTDHSAKDHLNLISFRVTDLMRSKIQCKEQ